MGVDMVIGIDGGGTHTRYLAVDTRGNVLAFHESGPCTQYNNPDVEGMMHRAIAETVEKAGGQLSDVVALVAGLADINTEKDFPTAERFTNVQGLRCPRKHTNDVDIAWAAVHRGNPGIVASGGTNWAGVAILESGERKHAYSFPTGGLGSASLAYEALHRLMAGQASPNDGSIIESLLTHWREPSLGSLIKRLSRRSAYSGPDMNLLRTTAPLVTRAAQGGSPIAMQACDHAADQVERSIRVMGSCFTSDVVSYGVMGSVARSPYIREAITKRLTKPTNKTYTYASRPLTAAGGAVWMAFSLVDIAFDTEVEATLRRHPEAAFDV